MIIEKTEFGYDAISYLDVEPYPISFIGFGDTHFEAIKNCLGKISSFLKSDYRKTDDMVEDNSGQNDRGEDYYN